MDNGERLVVRLSSDDLALLTELVSRGEFRSEADALSEALRVFLDGRFTPDEKSAVIKKSELLSSHDLNEFVSDGQDAGEILKGVMHRSESEGDE